METLLLNPLREGLGQERTAEPCTVVIFGASGDLTMRKLIPALYSLARQNLLAAGFSVVGSARTPMDDERFRADMKKAVESFADGGLGDAQVWESFAAGIFYEPTDIKNPESYRALASKLERVDRERGTQGNRLFYLSTPPELYADIVRMLGEVGLGGGRAGGSAGGGAGGGAGGAGGEPRGWTRIIVEKPFGRDLQTARKLNADILRVFAEDQVYRIDHYLGKETVQNIMVLRFANGIFEPLWNQKYVDHVQITAAESLGVENRGGYYETSGCFRDMLQNHLFQVFALVAMEPPASLDANAVRDEKTKVLRALRPIARDDLELRAARGQYAAGSLGGKRVKGYREEDKVARDSSTETFAAMKLLIDNWRWADVPFYLRSGKRVPKRVSEIAIQFKRAPHMIFKGAGGSGGLEPNSLIIRVQPDEGISLKFGAKLPGQAIQVRPVQMDFQYGSSFGKRSPEAYERLLLDAILGDPSLFARGDFVDLSWEFVMPILEAWTKPAREFPDYEAGTWGPKSADQLLERDGRRWRKP